MKSPKISGRDCKDKYLSNVARIHINGKCLLFATQGNCAKNLRRNVSQFSFSSPSMTMWLSALAMTAAIFS